jgi:hypothetical protein
VALALHLLPASLIRDPPPATGVSRARVRRVLDPLHGREIVVVFLHRYDPVDVVEGYGAEAEVWWVASVRCSERAVMVGSSGWNEREREWGWGRKGIRTCVIRDLDNLLQERLKIRSRHTVDMGDEVGRRQAILIARTSPRPGRDIHLGVQLADLLPHSMVRSV